MTTKEFILRLVGVIFISAMVISAFSFFKSLDNDAEIKKNINSKVSIETLSLTDFQYGINKVTIDSNVYIVIKTTAGVAMSKQ